MNKFFVLPTRDRRVAKGDYIVCISLKNKKSLKLGRFAVLVRRSPEIKRELRVPCQVAVDRNLGDDKVRVDQSLRNALGILFEYDEKEFTVEIYLLRLSLFKKLRYFTSYFLLGRRYLFFRVCKADISDLEKNICRIPMDCFKLLGCEEGDKVIYEYPIHEGDFYRLKEFAIRCFGAYEEMIKSREEMEEENISARYPSAERLLKVSPDIPRIFLDAHARETLQVEPLCAVRVRRDLSHLFLKQIREFGVILFLSMIASVQILPIKMSWQSLHLIFVVSMAIAFVLILLNIRAKIK